MGVNGTGSAVSRLSLRRGPGLVIIAVAVAVLILAAGAAYAVIRVRQHQEAAGLRPSGIPASVSTSLANLMQLSPVPVTSAPGFTLTDEGGRTMSLTSLRGQVVVLEFMDPHCTDICPIVSREFLDAYRDLGATAPRVVFVAVNVNRYHLQVADVAAFSSEQRLTQIPAWHFLTGSYPSLRAVWRAYQITVAAWTFSCSSAVGPVLSDNCRSSASPACDTTPEPLPVTSRPRDHPVPFT